MSNYERTRAEKIFFAVSRTVHNTIYFHPVLREGVPGWILHQLGAPLRFYRDRIWNRFAYNKDGRMTNETALSTIGTSLLVLGALAALACAALTIA